MTARNFKFKDVEVVFNIKKLPHYDQEYLRTMAFEAVGNRSIHQSGQSFDSYYRNAGNFSLFNSETVMDNYMSDFTGKVATAASHLLNGKKYWLAWTYSN
jgi:hypothetical protein